MALTNATILADWTSGIGTAGAVIQVDNANNRLGVGTTNPQGMLQVGTGITMYSTGIGSFTSDLYVGGDLNITGDLVYDEVTGRNLNITGIATVATLEVGSNIKLGNAGVVTATSFSGSGANLTGISAGLTTDAYRNTSGGINAGDSFTSVSYTHLTLPTIYSV